MGKRVTASLSVSVLSLWAGVAAYSQSLPRIVDIRLGKHAGYDRLVIELERRANIPTVGRVSDGSFVLELEAIPLLPRQTLSTRLKRLGTVRIRRTLTGTRIRVAPRPRRIRAYLLESPPRIVVDFADPGARAFLPPLRVEALKLRPLPAPTPAPPPEKRARPGRPKPAEPKLVATMPAPESPPRAEAPQMPPAAQPTIPPSPGPPDAPEPPGVEPVSAGAPREDTLPARPRVEAAPRIAPPPPAPRPVLRRKPPAPRPSTAKRDSLDGLSYLGMSVATLLTLLAIAGLGVALIAWVRMNAARRRAMLTRAATAGLRSGSGVETIVSDDLMGVADRMDILEKRIDEEIRARMHVEEHVKQLQEEIMVLRDPLHRIGRRTEASA